MLEVGPGGHAVVGALRVPGPHCSGGPTCTWGLRALRVWWGHAVAVALRMVCLYKGGVLPKLS
ncbi:MAG: hypothetical protein AAFV78_05645, partial [Bacteroidota bacterium]